MDLLGKRLPMGVRYNNNITNNDVNRDLGLCKKYHVVRLRPSYPRPDLLVHRLFRISVCYFLYQNFEIVPHDACMRLRGGASLWGMRGNNTY